MSKSLRLRKITWMFSEPLFWSNYYYFLPWLRKRIKSDNIHESTEPSHVLEARVNTGFLTPFISASPLHPVRSLITEWSVLEDFQSSYLCHLSFTFLLPIYQGLFLLMLVWPSRGRQEVSPVLPVTPWGEAVGLWASGDGRGKMRNKQMKHRGPGLNRTLGAGGWPVALICAEPERWPSDWVEGTEAWCRSPGRTNRK